MYLNKLQIFGFKSFADKVSVDFDSGVTAIVGPNGCGKTNIVDAVRWVIGEQKASVLRSSTMENVIFSGTKRRKQLSIAEVSLTIENTKGILPSEYTEITITRRCYRDGTSNYFLNGSVCRLKDITALFMDTGMGSDAYSVIELKMVNEILSHRTQDRRKLFEEAAGITKYKERRRESLYRLEQAKENLTEANIEIRNRQRTVNTYEKIAQKQQEAREISDKLKEIEIEYHTRYMSRLQDDIKFVEEQLKQNDEKREDIQVKLAENDKDIDTLKKELYEIESRLNAARESLNKINSGINDTQTSITMAEQRMSYLRENIRRYSSEKFELEKQIEKLEKNSVSIIDKIKVLNDTITLLDESRNNKTNALHTTDEKVKIRKEELKALSSDLSSVQKSLIEKHNDYKLTKALLDEQINRSSALTDENIKNITLVNRYEEQIDKLSHRHTERKKELNELADKYEDLKKQKEEQLSEVNRLDKEITYKTYELEKLKEKINFQVNLLESFEDYSEGVKYLIKDKKDSNAITVIDKIQVEDKFRIAIETALGEISSYLIVNDITSMDKLVSILENDDKGKVTFILRNNLYNMTMNIFQEEFPDIIGSEGVYGWADQFIKCPEEYWLLYRYLLDEYVIVENRSVAEKLSKDNFIKFITLDGDIITNSFVRTGGKTNIETIKLGREKLISDLEVNRAELEKQLSESAALLETAKTMYDSIVLDVIENDISALKGLISDIENESMQVVYKRDQSNLLIESNNKKIAVLSESNREITAKMDALIKELEGEENTKYLKEKELDAFTTNLENLTNELTEKRDEFSTFNIEVTKVQGELNTLMNDRTRNQNSIESRKRTIEARISEVNECEIEVNTLQESTGTMLENGSYTGQTAILKKLNAEKAVIESDLNFVMTEYNTRRSVVDELESQQKQLRSMRDTLIESIHKGEMKLADARADIREHKEKIMEYYGIKIEYNSYEDNETYDFTRTKFEIDKLRMRLKQLGGTGQMELSLYEEEKNSLMRLLEDRDDLVKAEEDLINLIEQINQTAQQKFIETFARIRDNFRNIFAELFMEGDEADLKLVTDDENLDPLEAKIDIIAKPRGKRPQLIDLLSGGEKTLTAIALLFAIYQVKPSPFCILDEVDAPLDDANIDRFVKIIRKFSKDTQFIIVTHNKRTMEAADSMYGVTMAEEGISTIVNVKFSDKLVTNN